MELAMRAGAETRLNLQIHEDERKEIEICPHLKDSFTRDDRRNITMERFSVEILVRFPAEHGV
ncbi:MAG: hypothetical protein ACLR0U_12755 [Enterocloster clostridioformis]